MRLFLLLFLFPISLFSQDSKFVLGLQGGAGYSNIDISNSNSPEYKEPDIGFIVGINLMYHFNNTISLRTGLNFERKSFKYKDFPIVGLFSTKYATDIWAFDYLVLPIMGQYSFGKKKNVYIMGGMFSGFLYNNQYSRKNYYSNATEIYRFNDFIERFNRFEFGITSGVGFSLPLDNKLLISFEIRNNYGLTNIKKSDINTFYSNTIIGIFGISYKIGMNNK